jgi:[protein-PII] uridylyltransferase
MATDQEPSGELDSRLRRGQLSAALAATRREFALEARHGRGGRAVQERYAAQMDAVVRQLVDSARTQTSGALVVCALGGYGRRTLCLHSDIDLMILFQDPIGRAEERFVNAVLQPLWDLQLVVGHQIRELSDFDDMDTGNTEFLLAVLDARPVAGDPALFERLHARVTGFTAEERGRAIDSLLELIEQRHTPFNGTIYQLEPDIKNAPGGLRDIAAIRYLQTLGGGRFDDDRARSAAVVQGGEDFLLRIRGVLHAESGRDANVLTHELQELVAEAMGYAGDGARRRVETLMSEYFRTARAASRALARSQRVARPPIERAAPIKVGRHFEIAADGIRFVDLELAASRPSLWVEIFRLALADGCPVSEAALDCIEQNLARYTADDFTGTEAERQQLRQLFHPRPGLYARLSEMHDCGLLTRILLSERMATAM